MTSAGRRQVEYTDVFDELSELAESTRPGWSAKSDRLKAVGLASILMQKLASLPLHLVGSCSGNRAYDLATLFRFPAADAFSGYFAMGWKAGYPSLTRLVGSASESSQALALAGRLLGKHHHQLRWTRSKLKSWCFCRISIRLSSELRLLSRESRPSSLFSGKSVLLARLRLEHWRPMRRQPPPTHSRGVASLASRLRYYF